MSEKDFEKPIVRKLYRQSSTEIRLSAIEPVEEENYAASDPIPKIPQLKIPSNLDQLIGKKLPTMVQNPCLPSKQGKEASSSHEPLKQPGYAIKELISGKDKLPSSCKAISDEILFLEFKKEAMASLRPKSPKPGPGKPEESFWDKIGTLGRKKRIKEVQEVQEEGKYAIDSPGNPTMPAIPPEEYEIGECEERSMIDPKSYNDPKLMELQQVLIDWVNDELASHRIIVQNLVEDLYDGQVLQKLLEQLTEERLDVPEMSQSEQIQKKKLAAVLNKFNQVLGLHPMDNKKWSVDAIHSKHIVPILHLLVALARHFRPPVRLPENVNVQMVVVQKKGAQLVHRVVNEKITTNYEDVGMRCERDAFDVLCDHANDKLPVVKKTLVTFVNKHLNKINLEVSDIKQQFHDGVYLVMLMGLLEGFFVPLYDFNITPKEFEQKVHNVSFAFQLMVDVGLPRPKARPEDIVNLDLKSTLRVLYNLFLHYRDSA